MPILAILSSMLLLRFTFSIPLSPDLAVLLFTVGLLLIYIELNRPGWIVPGSIGLLTALLCVAAITRYHLNPGAIALVISAVALLVVELIRRTGPIIAFAATLALILGFDHLVLGPNGAQVHLATAFICGLVLGGGTSVLTRIARRARANKGLD